MTIINLLAFVIVLKALYCCNGNAFTTKSDPEEKKNDIENHIKALKKSVISGELIGSSDVSTTWAQLGMYFLELEYIDWKRGGSVDALRCFMTARDVADRGDHDLIFSWSTQIGFILRKLSRAYEALNAFERASLSLDQFIVPVDYDRSRNLLYQAEVHLVTLKNIDIAVELANQSLSFNPCESSALRLMVDGLIEQGNLTHEEWSSFHLYVVNMTTKYIDRHGNWNSNCDRFLNASMSIIYSIDSNDESATKSAREFDSDTDSTPSLVYWSLYSIADKIDDRAKAWEYLTIARKLDRPRLSESTAFKLSEEIDLLGKTKQHYKLGYWPHPKYGIGSMSQAPVFIVGFFRSGSTLLESMLNAHKHVWGLGEVGLLTGEVLSMRNSMNLVIESLKEEMSKDRRKLSENDESSTDSPFKEIVNTKAEAILNLIYDRISDARKQIEADFIFRKRHFHSTNSPNEASRSSSKGKTLRIVDKMLSNYWHIGLIHLLYPNAVILHTMRDPMDTLFSCYKIRFSSDRAVWSLDVDTLTKMYSIYLEIMQHFRDVLPGRVIDVSYEVLISQPEAMLKTIVHKMQLPWDENILRFHEANRTIFTASRLQVRKAIYKHTVGSWRRYSAELAPLRESLQQHFPRLRALGALRPYADVETVYLTQNEDLHWLKSRPLISMNWELDDAYDYEGVLVKLGKTENHPEMGNTVTKSVEDALTGLQSLTAAIEAEQQSTWTQESSVTPMKADSHRILLWMQRGGIHVQLGRLDAALSDYDKALRALGAVAVAIPTASSTLTTPYAAADGAVDINSVVMSAYKEAVHAGYQDGRPLHPRTSLLVSHLHVMRAGTLSLQGRNVEAALQYKHAITRDPAILSEVLWVYHDYAVCLADFDELEQKSWQHLMKEMLVAVTVASEVSSSSSPPLSFSVSSRENSNDESLKSLLSNSSDSLSAASNMSVLNVLFDVDQRQEGIYWALFIAADKLHDYRLAWQYLSKAHEFAKTRVQLSSYSMDASTRISKNLWSTYVRGYWPAPSQRVGMDTKYPIFVVGFLRSGSTLLETMLSAHKNIWGMGEDSVFAKLTSEYSKQAFDLISEGGGGGVEVTNQESLANLRRLVLRYAEQTVSMTQQRVKEVGPAKQVKHVVDKMLLNYRHIGLIHLLFPNALILHTMRDPMDTLLSCFKIKFASNTTSWTLDMDSLVHEYILYLETMHHFRTQLPGRVVDISYEALIADPEYHLRAIVHRLGLPWDPSVLDYVKSQRVVYTASKHQVHRGIYTGSVGSWTRYQRELQLLIVKLRRQLLRLESVGALKSIHKGDVLQPRRLQSARPNSEPESESESESEPEPTVRPNWDLSVDFDYAAMLDKLSQRSKKVASRKARTQRQAVNTDDMLPSEKFLHTAASDDSWLRDLKLLEQTPHVDNAKKLNTYDQLIIHLQKDGIVDSTLLSTVLKRGRHLIAMRRFDDALEDMKYIFKCFNIRTPTPLHRKSANKKELLYVFTRIPNPETCLGPAIPSSCPAKYTGAGRDGRQLAYLFTAHALSLQPSSHQLEAAIYFRYILLLDPSDPDGMGIYHDLVLCLRRAAAIGRNTWKKLIEEMLEVEADNELNSTYRNRLFRALHLAYESVGEFSSSWRYLEKARALEKNSTKLRYKLGQATEEGKYMVKTFRKGFWPENIPQSGHLPVFRPLFIVGFYRSGVSFLQSILGMHKNIWALTGDGLLSERMALFSSQIQAVHETRRRKGKGKGNGGKGKGPGRDLTASAVLDKLQKVAGVQAAEYMSKIDELRRKSEVGASKAVKRVTDSLWANFKFIGLIHLLFPEAMILNVLRDPMDVLFSCMKALRPAGDAQPWIYHFDALAEVYHTYLTVLHHFREQLPGRIIDVSYEALLVNPEDTLRALILRLKLPWDERVLRHNQSWTGLGSILESSFPVGESIYTGGIGAWARYADFLQPLRGALLLKLTKLKKAARELPPVSTRSSILGHGSNTTRTYNWLLDPDFDYGAFVNSLKGSRGNNALPAETETHREISVGLAFDGSENRINTDVQTETDSLENYGLIMSTTERANSSDSAGGDAVLGVGESCELATSFASEPGAKGECVVLKPNDSADSSGRSDSGSDHMSADSRTDGSDKHSSANGFLNAESRMNQFSADKVTDRASPETDEDDGEESILNPPRAVAYSDRNERVDDGDSFYSQFLTNSLEDKLKYLDQLNFALHAIQEQEAHTRPRPTQSLSVGVLVQRGGVLASLGRVQEALQDFHESLRLLGAAPVEKFNTFLEAMTTPSRPSLLLGVGGHNSSSKSPLITDGPTDRGYADHTDSSGTADPDFDGRSVVYACAAEALALLPDRHVDAVAHYRQAWSLNPTQADTLYRLAVLLKAQPSSLVSQAVWSQLLDEVAEVAVAMHGPAALDLQSEPADPFRVAAAVAIKNGHENNNSEIYWALHTIHEAMRDYNAAWKFLEIAHKLDLHRLNSPMAKYRLSVSVDQANAAIAKYQGHFWPTPPRNIGHSSKLPVFIVGFFRSGSTLLETMLGAHPDVWGMGEDSVLAAHNKVLVSNTDPVRTRSLRQRTDAEWKKLETTVSAQANKILHILESRRSLASERSGKQNISRMVDKMLSNYKRIAHIHLLFPSAIILHTIRDPLDTLLSCYKIRFTSDSAVWSLDVATLVTEYVLYLKTIHHFRSQLPGRIYDVSYESLVADPQGILRSILQKLELNWDESVLLSHQTHHPIFTASKFQVQQPIFNSSIGSWRHYRLQLQPLIQKLRQQLAPLFESRALPMNITIHKMGAVGAGAGMAGGSWVGATQTVHLNWNLSADFNYSRMLEDLSPVRSYECTERKS